MRARVLVPVRWGEAVLVGRGDEGTPPGGATPAFAALTAGLRRALLPCALLAVLSAHAQQDTLYLRTLAANCAQCHGTEGHAAPGATLPPLAGRSRADLLAQLQAFKSGTRPSTIMQQLAKGYSDAQLEQLAAYFAAQK